jgi:cytidine deaminase
MTIDWEALAEAAREARHNAYAPYSKFAVGAAVLTESGLVVPGCNVENSTFGLTICAERTAVAAAVSQGHRRLRAVAVVADMKPPAKPCGLCLQMLNEFADGDLPVLLENLSGQRQELTLKDLLPYPFRLHRKK